jgi:hypothetical protein
MAGLLGIEQSPGYLQCGIRAGADRLVEQQNPVDATTRRPARFVHS